MKVRSFLLIGSALIGMAGVAAPALADDAPAQAASGSGNGLGEIVVTAQRRSENVMAVPLAIQAVSGAQLKETGINQMTDLQFSTPGYNVSDNSGYAQIYIRGVGNGIYVGADPSVATFIDDVPMIYGSLVNDFVNVQRVEVLKGAQGGLYGRNATGGVVNIITRQPSTDKVAAEFRASYGEYNDLHLSAYVNLPLSDAVALSVTGERHTHDGYDKNLANPAPYTADMFPYGSYLGNGAATATALNSRVSTEDLGRENFYSISGKLLIKAASNFKVTIAGDYNNKDDNSGSQFAVLNPATVQGNLSYFLNKYLGACSIPVDPKTGFCFGPGVNLPAGFEGGNAGKFTVSNGDPGFVRLKDYGVSATAVLNLTGVDLTSISAYRYQHTQFLAELSGDSVPMYEALVDNHKHYFYQELRAVSTFAGPLRLLGGATYLKTNYNGATTGDFFNLPSFGFTLAGAQTKVENWSIYGQGAYDLMQNLTFTASGRYIHETNNTNFFDGENEGQTEKRFLPSANLSYKLDGGGNVYVRWARGFKAGGVNPVALPMFFTDKTLGSSFKGEQIDTFEGGFKLPLMENKIQLTGDVFYNDYKNLQFQAHVTAAKSTEIIEAILNANKARTYGVEGSLRLRPIPPLTIDVNAGYLNAKFTDFTVAAGGDYLPMNLNGHQMPNAPSFQFSINGNLDQPINDKLRLVADALVSRTSKVLYAEGADVASPEASDPGYWLVNARIGVKTTDGQYGFSVYANNLFNTRYTVAGSVQPDFVTQLNWGNPRVVGAEFTAKF